MLATQPEIASPRRSVRWRLILLALLIVAGLVLWADHREHVVGVLPYVLIGLCVLMHAFHGRHGGGNPTNTGAGSRPGEVDHSNHGAS